MKVFTILALFIAVSSAGIVEHSRCGGVGICREIRCSGCEGAIAHMTPGTPYQCEVEIIPSSAAQELRLRVTATYVGIPINIIDAALPNSSVQPGVPFIVRFTITPNDSLSGMTLPVRFEVSNNGNQLVEACGQIHVCVAQV